LRNNLKDSALSKKFVVLGAGISGLTAAYLLNKKGIDVTVLEKNSEPGGSMESVLENDFLFDRGPNSGLEISPVIKEIVKDLNLEDQFVYANKEGNKRYILRNNQLHALPMSPPAVIKTKLFSTTAKLRVLGELFIGRSNDGYYQSVADFVRRRLGKEFLDYAIDPFVSGVYAGNPEKLSVKSAFPKLYALEEKYGGLIIGTIKSMRQRKKSPEKSKQSAKMFSFKNGMQTLPKAIASGLGNKVSFSSDVTSIEKNEDGYKIIFNKDGLRNEIICDKIISTVPAYAAADLFKSFGDKLEKHLREIYYPPVLVVMLGYKKENIMRQLDGFGFLIPSKEKKSFLGAIWNSVIFPNRANNDYASFTLFVGGSRNPEILTADKEEIMKKARAEFEEIMTINSEPVFISTKFWQRAIPQYNLGYIEHEKYFEEFEKNNPGIILSGNYRGGISVGDCMKKAAKIASAIFAM
jgi:protoporphyrinogen/coproporphyrinogen III oxidase